MRRYKHGINFFISVAVLAIFFIMVGGVSAHAGEENIDLGSSLASAENPGEALFDWLRSKKVQCTDLKDDDFGLVGEFLMERMMGTGHEAMDTMMQQMMGEAGEKAMHVTMGKRMSGCETGVGVGGGVMGSGNNMMGGTTGGVNQMMGMMPMMASMMGGGMMGGFTGQSQNMMGALGVSRPAYALGFVALWYVIGILLVVLLIMLILKLGKNLFK
ncbi:MAG: hypothetical protein UX17_C0081G0005 [Parcubacteria group bacterium GW2011_GWC2_45_7]|nr:MAG: hypothetical protein UX17_C0081G0005 [Parcubacteria group bacterium GW2011_GWC2_45_7]KKU73382.1 MAG: hypothetical protein UX98_C0008G0048 [Parcubacteria group bacterium GW2011_GWA2_47_26]